MRRTLHGTTRKSLEARALSLTLPIETFNYLALLATLGKLGRTENEVATHILVREVYAMHARGFHEMRIRRRTRTAGEADTWRLMDVRPALFRGRTYRFCSRIAGTSTRPT